MSMCLGVLSTYYTTLLGKQLQPVATGFDIEIDVAYWFDKSTKQNAGLEEFCFFL